MKTKQWTDYIPVNFSILKIVGFCMLFSMVLLTSRCAKDRFNDVMTISKTLSANSPDFKNRITAIKDSYNKLRLNEKLQPDQYDKLSWVPDWDHPRVQIVNDSVSYVFFKLLGFVNINGKNEVGKQINGKLYLMVKNEKEYYKAFYYNPNIDVNQKINKNTEEFELKSFTGNLLLSNLIDNRSYLLNYTNGHLSEAYQKKSKIAITKMQSVGGSVSYWETQCHTEVRNCTFSSLSPSWCGGSVNIVFSATCNWPPSSCGDTYSLTDSDEVVICEDVWFPDPPTDPGDNGGGGGGGGGGDEVQNTPLIDIHKDSILAKFPCVKSLVLDSLERISEYNNMVKPFMQNGSKPDLTWNANTQPWTNNNYSGGTTGISNGSFTGMSSDINLNSAMLQNSSKLLIAAVSIHETYHAYVNYLFASQGNVALLDESKPNYMSGLYQYIIYEQTGSSNNYTDHYNMLTSQFDNFSKILYTYGGGSFTMDECRKALLFGMNNAGPSPQFGQTQFINQAYNDLLAKYGYTAADVNAFHLQQINPPANKKLPTTGC